MSCPKSLRTDLLSAAETGGSWTYNGYSATFDGDKNNLAQFGAGGGGGVYTFPAPSSPIAGDDPSIDFDGATAGFYSFTYDVVGGACNDDENLVVEKQDPPCAGANYEITLGLDNATVDVFDLLDDAVGACTPVSTNGTWFFTAPNFNHLTGIWNIIQAAFGTYLFSWEALVTPETGFEDDCGDCTQVATVTINKVNKYCDKATGDYITDLVGTISGGSYALLDMKVRSLVVDGVEYVSTPISVGALNKINLGGDLYVTNIVDILNSLNAKHVSFAYTSEDDSLAQNLRYIQITAPASAVWQIVIDFDNNLWYRYSDNLVESSNNGGGTWTPSVAIYPVGGNTVLNYATFDDCN